MPVQYYPEDQQDSVIGIKFPMNGRDGTSRGGFFNTSRTTEDQAVSNYINLLLTKKGERYFQPEYGIGLPFWIFEMNTEANRIFLESEIRIQAARWLPYIVNESITVKPRAELAGLASDPENAWQIVIVFRVTNSLANKTITLFQTGGIVSYLVE